MRRSFSSIWISTSSASGRTETVAVDVWIRPAASVDWHALHAMDARLELQPRIRRVAAQLRDDLLETARARLRGGEDLDLPAPPLGIAGVHAIQVGGKQRCLVAARAGSHLDDDVPVVVRVTRDKLETQLLDELRLACGEARDLLAGHGPHLLVGIVGDGAGALELLPQRAPLSGTLDDRLQPCQLAPELGHGGVVGGGLGRRHLAADLLVACLQLREPVDHARAAAAASRSAARQDSSDAMLTSSIERSGGRVVSDWSHRPGAYRARTRPLP